MKTKLILLSAVCAGSFIACGDGAIATKSGDDELALLNYGEFNPDGMGGLVRDALAACNEDPECVRAMEKAEQGEIPADTDIESSDASADTSGTKDSTDTKPSANSSSGTSPSSATGSSSSATPSVEPTDNSSSSATVTPGSSSAVVSSSSETSPTKVRGACSALPNPVEKGADVTWKFANLTPSIELKTFDWTFEGASKATSTDASPVVQYASVNMIKGYGATLVVNKGLESESEPITCSVVKVTGTAVKNCACSASFTSVVASSSKPKDVTWSVSGCEGAAPFTNSWSNGTASGSGETFTVSVTGGTVTPKVTVTNSDGMTMTPTCPTVTVTELPGAKCNVGEHDYDAQNASMNVIPGQTFYFKPSNVTGVSGTKSMTLTGGGSTETVTVSNGNNNSATKLTAPTELGNYTYTLSVDGEEMCTAKVTVAVPKPSCYLGEFAHTANSSTLSAVPEQKIYFKPGDASFTGEMNMTVSLNGSTESIKVKPANNEAIALTAPSTLGTYPVTLIYENNQVCSASLKVEYPAITSTSCKITHNWNSTEYYFTPGSSFKNWGDPNAVGTTKTMTLYLDDEVFAADKIVNAYSNNDDWFKFAPLTEPGTHVFRLDYHGNTVCTVEHEVE